MKEMAAAMVVTLALIPAPLRADTPFWNEARICEAAVYTYFFLKQPPRPAGLENGFFAIRSASGYRYQCGFTPDGKLLLRWVNADGQPMATQQVVHEIEGDSLLVTTDMSTKRFIAGSQGWSEAPTR